MVDAADLPSLMSPSPTQQIPICASHSILATAAPMRDARAAAVAPKLAISMGARVETMGREKSSRNMKASSLALVFSAPSVLALSIPKSVPAPTSPRQATEQLYHIELEPGKTQQVTEKEKLALHNAGTHFMDVTNYSELHSFSLNRMQTVAAVAFPDALSHQSDVAPLIGKLDKSKMQSNLETFSGYHNRYYKSQYGKQSSEWLLSRVQQVIRASNASSVTAKPFAHSAWSQDSIIATIPGQNNNTIVIGAHLDSINGQDPSTGRAPGADDDGSGTMTILEAFRVLLTDPLIASGKAPNTIEFHWYAAEEGGLLGSQAIFTNYKNSGKVVKAMLQQDMTGYVERGIEESVGVITDYVDAGLTEFIKKVIDSYCSIPYVETKCGYACSDHASASKAGYPSAFVIEAAMDNTSPSIHTAQDTVSTVNFDHMAEHAKMTIGLAYELGFASGL